MMVYFYFREPSGKIVMSGSCAEHELEYQSCGDSIMEVGQADINKQYFGKNGLTDYPEKPSGDYFFDYASEIWVFDESSAVAKAMAKRDELLASGPDRINPLWWGSMTAEQKQSWSTYRQDLLDITQQPGFPADVTWPVKPE